MIALDAMGGDFAPKVSLEGALAAARKKIPVLLCGPQDLLVAHLDALDSSWKSYPLSFVNALEVIEMGEEAVRAVQAKPASSLVAAVKSVKDGSASACISAGNSGAFMAAATFVLGRHDGVERPAIAGFLPGISHPVLCLDLGANTECKPSYFLTFAHLGVMHLENSGIKMRPSVGLLSNGSEEKKGSLLTKAAYNLLKESSLNFIGNVEPIDIFSSRVDVVVCDGFSGNILLKTAEATAHLISQLAAQECLGQDMLSFARIKKRMGFEKQGGALLLGVKGTVVVAHGAADARAIEHAIVVAWESSNKNRNVIGK